VNEAIHRILDKLATVRQRGLTCFGSDHHRFQLNPPIDEGAIRRFERKHATRLPEDYRTFLRLAGNGGAGPYYGLLPLKKWNEAALEEQPGYLARPSPLRPEMPAGVEWEQALNCSWEDLFQGTLALVHQGCSYYALLVVTGAYRGRVVYVNLDRCGSPYFVHHTDFLSWYERWLDELLEGYNDSWFGFGLPGREPDLVQVLREGGNPDLRSAALTTLTRLASLRPETLEVLRALLGDASAGVRAQVCYLLGKHEVAAASADIAAHLEDDDPAVREAALDALTRLPGADWEPAARWLLRDGSESVVFRALCLLKDAGLLRRADVEPLFRSPEAVVRRNALWASDAIRGEAVEVSDDLLRDPDQQVRNHAFARWGRENPAWVAILADLLRRETDVVSISCLVRTLGEIGDRTAVPVLIEMTRHADAFVRQDAARALGKLRDRRAIPALSALLSDHTRPHRRDEHGSVSNIYTVAQIARTALEEIQGP
jgi:HEAT repeat protein